MATSDQAGGVPIRLVIAGPEIDPEHRRGLTSARRLAPKSGLQPPLKSGLQEVPKSGRPPALKSGKATTHFLNRERNLHRASMRAVADRVGAQAVADRVEGRAVGEDAVAAEAVAGGGRRR